MSSRKQMTIDGGMEDVDKKKGKRKKKEESSRKGLLILFLITTIVSLVLYMSQKLRQGVEIGMPKIEIGKLFGEQTITFEK